MSGIGIRGAVFAASTLAFALSTSVQASAATLYFQGFETDTTDWATVNRVASGTGGVTSAAGSFHATVVDTAFTRWSGYGTSNGGPPAAFKAYQTSVDIYLNVSGGYTNNSRFDFSSAISKSDGTFLRDFIFNAGFYNDATGPGAGVNRFVVSASNNSQPGSAFAKNPDKSPIAITETGWYTFQHSFYEDGGKLFVDMTILDSTSNIIATWMLGGADLIGDAGGNRYGWFDYNQFTGLAIDNASLSATGETPLPAALPLFAGGLGMIGLLARRRKQKAQAAV